MPKEEYLNKSQEEQEFVSKGNVPKKQIARLQIPYNLRFALAWTLLFIIIGITIQSIQAGRFIFSDFFTGNYAAWFRSFGNFVNPTAYGSPTAVVISVMSAWYYFFYTGGLISIIWTVITGLVNSEISFTSKKK